MTSNMPYTSQHTAKLLSPKVWGQFPIKQASCMIGGEYRIADFRDAHRGFIDEPGQDNDAAISSGDIRDVDSAKADIIIKRSLGDGSAVLDWTPADTEDLVVGPQMVFDMSTGRPWAFECRISDADASANSLFAGLVSLNGANTTTFDAYTTNNILIDGGTLFTNRAVVGFQATESASVFGIVKNRGTTDTVSGNAQNGYQVNGSDSAIKEGETISAVATMADDTFVKLGMYSDGARIRWFVDNAEVANLSMGSTELPSGSEDAGVPDYDRNMVPVVALNAAGTTLMQVHWVACGYLA
jgi:hypothetical protein